MARQPKETRHDLATVEVSRSYLRLVVVPHATGEGASTVRTRIMRWRHEARSLLSDAGVAELTRAFKKLVADEKLTGSRLRVTLTGDFCVTRVLAGSEERVRRELAALEDRSQRYLTLGPGRKALAGSIRQLDARHQHALLTVSNQKTLETLMHVATHVGVQFELVEPSLVALSRVLGELGYDKDQPAMIVDIGEQGVDVGISYEGQLLLDYRPGGREVHGEAAAIIIQHLARLRRYCQRYFRYTQGKLERIYVSGSPEQIAAIREGFQAKSDLQVETLDPAKLDLPWRYADAAPDSEMAAAIGTCLVPAGGDLDRPSPNLLDNLDQQFAEPFPRLLLRVGWPVAAVLLLAAGLLLVNLQMKSRCQGLQTKLAAFEAVQTEAQQYRVTLARAEKKREYYQQIENCLVNPAWNEVVEMIGRCLPGDVWLDRLQLQRDGKLNVTGLSHAEEGVFEFVSWLEKSPHFHEVALHGTSRVWHEEGEFIQFQLECKLVDRGDEPVLEIKHD